MKYIPRPEEVIAARQQSRKLLKEQKDTPKNDDETMREFSKSDSKMKNNEEIKKVSQIVDELQRQSDARMHAPYVAKKAIEFVEEQRGNKIDQMKEKLRCIKYEPT